MDLSQVNKLLYSGRMKSSVAPLARKDDLITRQIPGELLVYDLKRHKAMCLNQTAAAVWRRCDGKRTVTELTAELRERDQLEVNERVVRLALEMLNKSRLLAANVSSPDFARGITRRRLVSVGIASAIALPVITMILAPTAQAAGTTIVQANCIVRKPSDPGGCTGFKCSNASGSCIASGATKCKCG